MHTSRLSLPRVLSLLLYLIFQFAHSFGGIWASYPRLPEDALERALAQVPPEIHHFDQGRLYPVPTYVATLEQRQVQLCTAEVGAAW